MISYPRCDTRKGITVIAELHNDPLARQLAQLIRRISHRETTPSRTGIGTRIAVPQVLQEARRGSGSPWLDTQAMRLELLRTPYAGSATSR